MICYQNPTYQYWFAINIPQNTPTPGTYNLKTFIEEGLSNPVTATYNFKNEGRKRPPLVLRNDPVLTDLPQYMPPDFVELLSKQLATYSFKDKGREDSISLNNTNQVKCGPLGHPEHAREVSLAGWSIFLEERKACRCLISHQTQIRPLLLQTYLPSFPCVLVGETWLGVYRKYSSSIGNSVYREIFIIYKKYLSTTGNIHYI